MNRETAHFFKTFSLQIIYECQRDEIYSFLLLLSHIMFEFVRVELAKKETSSESPMRLRFARESVELEINSDEMK